MKKPFALLLFGPTGVGKTELLLRLFAGRAEVISADSMQVYRGLDIGTAKPDPDLLRSLPHHLIDIRDPREQYTVGDFVSSAEKLIISIGDGGKIPVVSGGTAYYFRNLIFGLPPAPPADMGVRARLEEECALQGTEEMHRRLRREDPTAADRISPRDRYRILRALEVQDISGRPLSSFPVPDSPRKDMDFLVVGLTRPREELHRRIDERVEAMFRRGLPGEVAGLMRRGFTDNDPGLKGIGYREFFSLKNDGCLRLKDAAELIKTASRRFAKRQLTFFRSLPGVLWVHPDDDAELSRIFSPFF